MEVPRDKIVEVPVDVLIERKIMKPVFVEKEVIYENEIIKEIERLITESESVDYQLEANVEEANITFKDLDSDNTRLRDIGRDK